METERHKHKQLLANSTKRHKQTARMS